MNGYRYDPDTSNSADAEEIECAVLFPSDFPYPDLLRVAKFLEDADVLTPGYIPPPVGLCHPDGFIYEKNFEDIKTILLPDRNVASRFAKIAKGVIVDDLLQPVASLLTFVHFLGGCQATCRL